MSYSNFHKNRNPFSPARLDEAFKASKILLKYINNNIND